MHKYVYLYCTRLIISTEKTIEHQTQCFNNPQHYSSSNSVNFKVIFIHTQTFYRTFYFNNKIRCNLLFLLIYSTCFDITIILITLYII